MANQTTRAVSDAVDVDRAVELVRQVCRIPSVLGEEGKLAAFLAEVMKESGFEDAGLQPVLPQRPNAVGHLDFGSGPAVVFTGHMDTKPVSRGWSVTEPFAGDLVDRRVYGHGIMDMKAALVCQIVAIEALRDVGVGVRGRLAMAAVSDHMGDQKGSIAYFDEYPADFCVLGELSDNRVCIGHRGRYYFDVTVVGRSAHSCNKHLAVNANTLAAHAILSLEESKLQPPLEDGVRELFGAETFVVPGRVYGGLPPGGPSMIPDECVIRVDCRPQPGVDVDMVRAEIDRCLQETRRRDPRFRAEVALADEKPPYVADREDPVVGHMVAAVRDVTGGQPPLVTENWLGDTASFGHKVPTVIFGPGREPVYCADEHLSIEDIHTAARVYAAFAARVMADDTEGRGE